MSIEEWAELVGNYVEAYCHYCWPVDSIADLKLAPFRLLATEGRVNADKNYLWHMPTLSRICQADEGLLLATDQKVVDLTDQASQHEAIRW